MRGGMRDDDEHQLLATQLTPKAGCESSNFRTFHDAVVGAREGKEGSNVIEKHLPHLQGM